MPRYECGLKGFSETTLVDAATRGKARYKYFLSVRGGNSETKITEITVRRSDRPTQKEEAAGLRDDFNTQHGIGDRVRYWTFLREGEGKIGTLRTEATILSSNNVVVWLNEEAGCVSISHVEAAPAENGEAK